MNNPESSFGFTVEPLTDEHATRLGVEAGRGVVVTDVRPGSPGAAAGLRRGDVIHRVGSQSVSDLQQFSAILSQVDSGDGFRLQVQRGAAKHFLMLRPVNE